MAGKTPYKTQDKDTCLSPPSKKIKFEMKMKKKRKCRSRNIRKRKQKEKNRSKNINNIADNLEIRNVK